MVELVLFVIFGAAALVGGVIVAAPNAGQIDVVFAVPMNVPALADAGILAAAVSIVDSSSEPVALDVDAFAYDTSNPTWMSLLRSFRTAPRARLSAKCELSSPARPAVCSAPARLIR